MKVTRADAKTVSCPRCSVLENDNCIGAKGQQRKACHVERFRKFQGKANTARFEGIDVKPFKAKYSGKCNCCNSRFPEGADTTFSSGKIVHLECA